jgi:hypothetical protein
MENPLSNPELTEQRVFSKIHFIRNQKVLLDADLAAMYGVSTMALNQAVKRNRDRFPDDFMFQLTENEHKILISQIVISSWGGRRTLPFAFTEQGVAMLSSVLKSKRAIAINIQIMRIFVKMRQLISEYKELLEKIEKLEASQTDQDERINQIYNLIKELLEPVYKDRPRVGYKSGTPI